MGMAGFLAEGHLVQGSRVIRDNNVVRQEKVAFGA
jgi:hypothetical protein